MSRPVDFSTMADAMFDLYRAGEYGQALELVDKNAAVYPEQAARITFWRVCLLSRCGRGNEALSALANGLETGLWWHESQFRDADLDSLRDLPGFKELVEKSQERWLTEGKSVKPDRTILVPTASGPYPLLIALHGYSGDKDFEPEILGVRLPERLVGPVSAIPAAAVSRRSIIGIRLAQGWRRFFTISTRSGMVTASMGSGLSSAGSPRGAGWPSWQRFLRRSRRLDPSAWPPGGKRWSRSDPLPKTPRPAAVIL